MSSIIESPTSGSKRRQVRYSYSSALTELAISLALAHGRYASSKMLSVPLSSVYRWFSRYRATPERFPGIAQHDRIERLKQLVATCEEHGFDVRKRIAEFEPIPSEPVGTSSSPDQASVPSVIQQIAVDRLASHALCGGKSSQAAKATVPGVSSGVQTPGCICEAIEMARAHIHNYYFCKLSCPELSRIAGTSRFHLIRAFKTALGVTPYRYLMQVRIHHAKQLLCSAPQSLDVIASAVGFDSLTSLGRSFKKIEGVSIATFYGGARFGYVPSRKNPPIDSTRRMPEAGTSAREYALKPHQDTQTCN